MKNRDCFLAPFVLTVVALSSLPSLAHAHAGHGAAGLIDGIAHPLGGVDHLLAMVAVGLWAAQLGRRALWIVPGAFVLSMAAGGVAGMMGLPMAIAEQGIVLSVLVLGCLVAAAVRLPLLAGAAVIGVFAIFHGYAHGVEMPADAAGLGYGFGFLATTALLHMVGIGIASAARMLGQGGLARLSGGAIAMSGLYLWLA